VPTVQRQGIDTAVVAAVVAAVLALTAACGSAPPAASPPAVTVVRPPDTPAGSAPAAPTGEPVLTVSGRIAAAGGALRLDRAGLDAMGVLQMTVDDPWAKRRLPLRGVWLRDLVERARPDAAATTLHVTALDDYQVDLALADVRAQGILLATRTGDGADLPLEDGGPTRVVFADGLAERFSPDLWIWNIRTIEVR
jgi:hypothetical protein